MQKREPLPLLPPIFFFLRSWQSCRASSVGTYRAPERLYAGRKGISKMILSIHYQWKPLTYHDRWKFLGLNFALLALPCYYVHLSKICHCCIWYLLPFCKSRILKSAPVMAPCSIFSVPLKCLLMRFLMWGAFLHTKSKGLSGLTASSRNTCAKAGIKIM